MELTSDGTQGNKSPAPLYVPLNYLARYALNKAISSYEAWVEVGEQVNPTALLEGQYLHATITFYENGNGTGRSATFAEMSINKTYSHIDYLSSYGFDNLTSSFKVIYDNIM